MSELPHLLEAVRRASRARDLSRKTENAYVNHIRRFRDFYAGRDLAKIGEKGINDFLEHLQETEKLAAATRNQALSALAFLFRDVFGQKRAFGLQKVKRAKAPVKPPAVFTPEEAERVLAKMRGETRLVAALMYGSGLRISEAVALRVRDIDFRQREIVVRNPQTGRRERATVLPEAMVAALENHLVNVRYLYEDDRLLLSGKADFSSSLENQKADVEWRRQFVFPSHNLAACGKGGTRRLHLAESTVQKAIAEAILKANIIKPAGCQTFRYSFAARLFESGYDIRRVQTLLGHKNLKTTVVYTRFASRAGSQRLRSPLDN